MNICDRYTDKIEYFNELGPSWNERVGNDELRLEMLREVFTMISLEEGDTVLDVGCGNGVLFNLTEERIGPEGHIHALDLAAAMIDRAKRLHPHYRNISYHVGLIEDITLPENSFDVILCFAVFPHIEDKLHALKVMRKLITDTGKLYIFHLSDTHTLNDFHGNLNAPVSRDHMPEEEEMHELLRDADFRIVQYRDHTGLNFIEIAPC
jgi:2-polyprenyl-3-methyl-5-hydroxy-6-metoxy-1,4-benzoquinol methylase